MRLVFPSTVNSMDYPYKYEMTEVAGISYPVSITKNKIPFSTHAHINHYSWSVVKT